MRKQEAMLVHVVDDDDAVREAVALLLACSGWRAALYPGAHPFLDALYAGRVAGDLLLLDLHMPATDGATLLETLGARHLAPPTVVLTAAPECDLARRAWNAGAVAILAKPLDPALLLRTLAAAVATTRAKGNASRSHKGNP